VDCTDLDGDGFCVTHDCEDALSACTTNCTDADRDGFPICAGDCDDSLSYVHPGAPERCNGLDDDCNGLTDDDANGEDSDNDAVANVCDNCPTTWNPTQDDSDSDSVGDDCDNCILERNTSQSDADSDNEGDLCDLDDGLIYILFHQPEYVEWQEEIGFSSWNSYRGDLEELRYTGIYTQDPALVPLAARTCDLVTPSMADGDPPPGAAVFFLTTGNATETGAESSLGPDGFGVERPNTNPCP